VSLTDGHWFARRSVAGEPGLVELLAVTGPHPATPGGPVDEQQVLAAARMDNGGQVVHVRVAPRLTPRAPALWYVSIEEPDADPAALTLVAFDTPHAADGTVVGQDAFTSMPVPSSQQVAAVRWFTGTGQVHQIYVQPACRRRGVATKVLVVAGMLAVATGRPRLWGNGERTDLGEALATRGPELFRGRVTPRTRALPPMTPEPLTPASRWERDGAI
jgi:hypothetical protein